MYRPGRSLSCVQETLRINPSVFFLVRSCSDDDIIPLSKPITTTTGSLIDSIPVGRGTSLHCSLWGYNQYAAIDNLSSTKPDKPY